MSGNTRVTNLPQASANALRPETTPREPANQEPAAQRYFDEAMPLTDLPKAPSDAPPSDESAQQPSNPARDVQNFVGGALAIAWKPADLANTGLAKLTEGLSRILPCFPAARLFVDLVLGWPHGHAHPPTFGFPLPSIGPVICAGATNVLINGLPAVRLGDVGFGVWCGGFYPLFEVFTGSSHVFIGGARAARQIIDFTRHCLPTIPGAKGVEAARKGISKLDKAMMGFVGVMGALGMTAALVDQSNYEEQEDSAESEADAAEAAAYAHAAGVEAAMAALQAAADILAMALSIGMGKDPGVPPLTCFGNFILGSPNVVIGGFPMVGWTVALRGLGKMLKRPARKISQRVKQNKGCGKQFEPVDVVTGANVDSFIDFSWPAPQFVWRRWYHSDDRRGPLGWGFRHEYERELSVDQSGLQFTYTDQEGQSIQFPAFLTELSGEEVVQHGAVLTRLSAQRYALAADEQPTLEFEFRELIKPGSTVASPVAVPVALSDEERNFTFEYDADGRLIRIRLDQQRVVDLVYSLAGLLGEVVLRRAGEEPIYVARYRHDDDGRLVEFHDALNQTARYEYDHAHRMTSKTDRRGYSYHYRYDEEGRCIYTTGDDGLYKGSLEYHPDQNITVVTYSDGGRWTYEYNELGTVTKITDPYGGVQHRIVDEKTGLVSRELDPAGNATELLYDKSGADIGRRDPFGYWTPPLDVEPHPPDPLQRRLPETPLEWEFGNLLDKEFVGAISPDNSLLADFPEAAALANSRHPELASPRFASETEPDSGEKYDLIGRLIERQVAEGAIERWQYDAEGNNVLYIDGDGGAYRREFTSWNLLDREIDPAGNTCSFQYSSTEEITRFTDAGGAVHDFVYDKKDRLVEVRRNGVVHDIYRYDEADNLIEKMDGEGRRLLVCSPGPGRLNLARHFADGEVHGFEYNERGRCIEARTRRETVVFDYDRASRLTKDERDGLGVEHRFAGEELIATRVFRRFVSRYEKRFDGSLKVTDPTGRTHTFYPGVNGLILKALASGTRELVQYDAKGRCLRKILKSADGRRHSKRYRYSAAGDLLQVTDSERSAIEYHYDAAHRIKIAGHDDGRTELYAHDAAGNLVLQPGLNGLRIGPGNRLVQANGERFSYDYRGNLVLREDEERTTRYEYDSNEQLIRSMLRGREWRSDYDALGRRTKKRYSGQTTNYYWDNDRLAAEISDDGGIRIYLYANEWALAPFLYLDYRHIDSDPQSGIVKYLFTNHLGVPEQVEDDSGKLIWQGEAAPYGEIRTEFGSRSEINLRFPGHYYDAETGLHYNRFRYYDPILGCYTQYDPLGIAGEDNLYAYLANPLTGVDLLGLHPRNPRRSRDSGGDAGRPAAVPRPKSRPREMIEKLKENVVIERKRQGENALEAAKRKAAEWHRDHPDIDQNDVPGVITVVWDKKNGKTYTSVSGHPPLRRGDAHPNLGMPATSREKWEEPGNCGEPKAMNAALWDGARKKDLQVATVDLRNPNRRGQSKPCCRNCQQTTRGTTVITE